MNKQRWLLAVGALALAGLLLGWCFGWFEPRYGGMRASAYVFQELDTPRFSTDIATEKLRPMGAKLAVPRLIHALEYEDSKFRQKYATTYAALPGRLKKFLPVPRSVQHLRRNAITALGVFGPESALAVPRLAVLYTNADAFQHQGIARTLGEIGPAARAVVPVLLNDLTNYTGQRYPHSTIAALGKIDLSGELSAREIIPFADDGNYASSIAALNALANMSRLTPALATNLWATVRRGTPATGRGVALRHLNNLGLLTREALEPWFLQLTNNSNQSLRLAAIGVVTFSTNFAGELLPLLCRLGRDDPEAIVRNAVLSPLLRYAAKTNLPPQLREEALFLVMARGTNGPSWDSMDAVRGLSPHGASLIPLLVPQLQNPEPRLRGKVAEALTHIGTAAAVAAPGLHALLDDEWAYVREAATNALQTISSAPARP